MESDAGARSQKIDAIPGAAAVFYTEIVVTVQEVHVQVDKP